MTTVVEAVSAVMGEVQSVRKSDRNRDQGYSFRGVDAVVNAVGPALRKHGVVVVPVAEELSEEHYSAKSGAKMRSVTLRVRWRFYGPDGDHIEAVTYGEAADSSDKAVPKAHSVAYRVALLQALCIPTDEADPDSHTYERDSRPVDRERPSQPQHDQWQTPDDRNELARNIMTRLTRLGMTFEQADAEFALSHDGLSLKSASVAQLREYDRELAGAEVARGAAT